MGNFQKYWSQNVGQDFVVLDFFVGGISCGRKRCVREINVSRAWDPVHVGDKALTRETPAKRGRVNRYVYNNINVKKWQRICGVTVNVLASSAVDRGFVASSLSTQHSGERAKTGWLGIMIMCRSGATCLSTDCCFSELALCKSS